MLVMLDDSQRWYSVTWIGNCVPHMIHFRHLTSLPDAMLQRISRGIAAPAFVTCGPVTSLRAGRQVAGGGGHVLRGQLQAKGVSSPCVLQDLIVVV